MMIERAILAKHTMVLRRRKKQRRRDSGSLARTEAGLRLVDEFESMMKTDEFSWTILNDSNERMINSKMLNARM